MTSQDSQNVRDWLESGPYERAIAPFKKDLRNFAPFQLERVALSVEGILRQAPLQLQDCDLVLNPVASLGKLSAVLKGYLAVGTEGLWHGVPSAQRPSGSSRLGTISLPDLPRFAEGLPDIDAGHHDKLLDLRGRLLGCETWLIPKTQAVTAHFGSPADHIMRARLEGDPYNCPPQERPGSTPVDIESVKQSVRDLVGDLNGGIAEETDRAGSIGRFEVLSIAPYVRSLFSYIAQVSRTASNREELMRTIAEELVAWGPRFEQPRDQVGWLPDPWKEIKDWILPARPITPQVHALWGRVSERPNTARVLLHGPGRRVSMEESAYLESRLHIPGEAPDDGSGSQVSLFARTAGNGPELRLEAVRGSTFLHGADAEVVVGFQQTYPNVRSIHWGIAEEAREAHRKSGGGGAFLLNENRVASQDLTYFISLL
ncbi:MAG: hypothetical protein WC777_01780 [Candidatus Gracilibacteria bacterium]